MRRRNNKFIIDAYQSGLDIHINTRSDFRCMLFDGDNRLLKRMARYGKSKAFNGLSVFALVIWITKELKRNHDTIMLDPFKIGCDLKMDYKVIEQAIVLLTNLDIICNVVDEVKDYYMINPMYMFKGNVDKFIRARYYDIIGDEERAHQHAEATGPAD
jgi:hypothetical protein